MRIGQKVKVRDEEAFAKECTFLSGYRNRIGQISDLSLETGECLVEYDDGVRLYFTMDEIIPVEGENHD